MDGDPRHILIVDDDPDILAIAQLALTDIGNLSTDTAHSAQTALEALATRAVDLVLMDLRLDPEDGPEVWRTLIRAADSAPRVIFVTGARSDEVIGLDAEEGFLGIIKKPFDPMTLADTVRRLWEARA